MSARQRSGSINGEISVLGAEFTDGGVVFEGETDGVHAGVASGAARVGPMLLHPLAQGPDRAAFALSTSSGTFGGGGGGGVPRIWSRIQRPRLTGEVRVGFEVMVKMLACVKMPPRSPSASFTFTKALPRIGWPGLVPFLPGRLPFVSLMP